MTAPQHYQLTTLPNGLRVATERLAGVETATVTVSVDVGARCEEASDGGISHMLEHMAFKGTSRRSARQIAEEFDMIGGHLNAYTSHESTVYYAKVLKGDIPAAVDMLADILQHSTFDEEELARERQVILQEIAMHHDTPDELVFDHFQAASFPSQALGRSILGTPERVASFSRDDLKRYMAMHYHPSRMIISAAGAVDHEALVSLVAAQFTQSPSQPSAKLEPAEYRGGATIVERELEQLHVVMGLPSVSFNHADYYAHQLLSIILGGGMSSRLFQEVREKRGLAYHVSAFVSGYEDTGLLGVYAATSDDKTAELMPVLCEQLQSCAESIDETELRRAKNQQISGLLMTRESTSSVAEWIGRHLLCYGRYKTAQELTEVIEAITVADITRAARHMLQPEKLTLAALGPCGTMPDIETVRRQLAA